MANSLSVEDFFAGLEELLKKQQAKGKGSIYLTQKRGNSQYAPVKTTDGTDPLLIRASDSKNGRSKSGAEKVKLSTWVAPTDLDTFYERYATLCKAGMLGLKPRDKSKKKKQKKKKKTGPVADE